MSLVRFLVLIFLSWFFTLIFSMKMFHVSYFIEFPAQISHTWNLLHLFSIGDEHLAFSFVSYYLNVLYNFVVSFKYRRNYGYNCAYRLLSLKNIYIIVLQFNQVRIECVIIDIQWLHQNAEAFYVVIVIFVSPCMNTFYLCVCRCVLLLWNYLCMKVAKKKNKWISTTHINC